MNLSIRKREIGNIPALEVVEEERKNQLLPLIVYYHGWQINKELLLTQARKLAEKGLRVVMTDALNHGERKQPVSNIPSMTFFSSIHANLFEFSYIIEYFKKRALVKDQIGVGGLSMGGMTTCALLTHHPEIKAAACLMGTPSLVEYRDRIKLHASELGIHIPPDFEALTSWIEKYDLSNQPEVLGERPLFFWHGYQDDRVPYQPVERFIKKNSHLNIKSDFEDAGHLVVVKTMEKVAEFFASALLSDGE